MFKVTLDDALKGGGRKNSLVLNEVVRASEVMPTLDAGERNLPRLLSVVVSAGSRVAKRRYEALA